MILQGRLNSQTPLPELAKYLILAVDMNKTDPLLAISFVGRGFKAKITQGSKIKTEEV